MTIGYYYIDDENFNLLPQEFVKIDDLSQYKNDKPLLLIGYLKNKDKFNLDIDETKIDDNLFWTFSISEYRDRFNKDLFFFKEYCYNIFFNSIQYVFFNMFEKKYSDLKKLFKFLYKNEIFMTDDMLYLIYKNKVIGIDLNQIDRFFCPKLKIVNKIKSKYKYRIIDQKIKNKYKGFIEFNNSNYIIPYLINLDEKKIK